MLRSLGRPPAESPSLLAARTEIYEGLVSAAASYGISDRINPVLYWGGDVSERDVLIQFYNLREVQGVLDSAYELELCLGQDPGTAQEVFDELADFLILTARTLLNTVEATVKSRSITGLSPASGGTYTVLSVLGTRGITYEGD